MSSLLQCSCTCGGGIRVRPSVECTLPNGTVLEDSFCNADIRPQSQKVCNTYPCLYAWQAGNWSPVSHTTLVIKVVAAISNCTIFNHPHVPEIFRHTVVACLVALSYDSPDIVMLILQEKGPSCLMNDKSAVSALASYVTFVACI